MEKWTLEKLESRNVHVTRNGYQCGVGGILEDQQYDGAMRNENYVISWILRGDGLYQENGTAYPLTDFCVCMRRPGRKYAMRLDPKYGMRLFLTIPQDTYPALQRMIPELDSIPPVWQVPFDREIVEEFCVLYDHMESISSLELYTALPKMILYILHLTGIQTNREKDPLALGKGMLEENWTLPLEDIAERCGMKYNTFRKRFTEVYGISPGQYRIRCRIEEGSRLLAGGMSVSKTAVLLGYTDVYSFTHQFSTVKGIPPGRYAAQENGNFL